MAEPTFDNPLLRRAAKAMRFYHRYRAHGIDNIPTQGPCLLVVNHSFATYDIGMLVETIERYTGRSARPLGDRALFSGPDRGRIVRHFGISVANPENGIRLLEDGELVLVAPGGMREALRPSTERYRIRWQKRRGFVRLALAAQAPIVLAACPDADRLYRVYENRLTKVVYKRMRLPFPVLRGWGPTLVPRPVVLRHELSEPMFPPSTIDDESLNRWHGEICDAMESLMVAARAR